jgi:hypothetical protein
MRVIEIKNTRDAITSRASARMMKTGKVTVKKIKSRHCSLQLSTHDRGPRRQSESLHIGVVMTRIRSGAAYIDIEIPTDPIANGAKIVIGAETVARTAVVGVEDQGRLEILMSLNRHDLTRRQRMVTLKERLIRTDENQKNRILAGSMTVDRMCTLVASDLNP